MSIEIVTNDEWNNFSKTEPPSLEDCCKDARELDTLQSKVDEIIGPHEELEVGMQKWAKCQPACEPRLPAYPCRGVIR